MAENQEATKPVKKTPDQITLGEILDIYRNAETSEEAQKTIDDTVDLSMYDKSYIVTLPLAMFTKRSSGMTLAEAIKACATDNTRHAEAEIDHFLNGYLGHVEDEDEANYIKYALGQTLDIIRILDQQGHTDASCRRLIGHVKRLYTGKPLTPLTGKDDEWEPAPGKPLVDGQKPIEINKRCKTVWREAGDNSTARDSGAFVMSTNGGWAFQSLTKEVMEKFPQYSDKVEFPYMPTDNPMSVFFDYPDGYEPELGEIDVDKMIDITDDPAAIEILHQKVYDKHCAAEEALMNAGQEAAAEGSSDDQQKTE